MKKVIDICTRVEGHGQVSIFLDNQNESISHVDFDLEAIRGFENILLNKNLTDIPKIASRVCGLCHISQSIASCKAIENIYDIKVPERSILLRKLLMTGELIKSHSMHFFFQEFPDLCKIFNLENKPSTPYDLTKFDPQLTSNMYDLIKIGNDIDNLFGGRSVHPITVIPGGLIYKYSRKVITLSMRYLQKALLNLEYVINKFTDLFSDFNPPEYFNLPDCSFLGLTNHGKYDRYTGMLRKKHNKNEIIDFPEEDYKKYFDKDPELRGINIVEGKNILVGPLSRYQIIEDYEDSDIYTFINNFDKSWYKNLLFTNFLKLLELYIEIKKSTEILDHPALKNREFIPTLESIKNRDGIGIVEAPRGTLIHHYHLDKNNSLDQVKLFVATEFNLPLINQMITNYAQELYEKNDVNEVKKELQLIIRAFDPCISCATH
jgi:coenzyme F420-reducing hydrogenase alpha subunit